MSVQSLFGKFPPTLVTLKHGISVMREVKNIQPRGHLPLHQLERMLKSRLIFAGPKRYQVLGVKFEEVAQPIQEFGDLEMMPEFILAGAGAALAGAAYVGRGEELVEAGDGAATLAVRQNFYVTNMRGRVKGAQGKGRSEMTEEAPLFLDERVGTGRGLKVDILADLFEVGDVIREFNPEDPGYSGALSLLSAANAEGGKGFRRSSANFYLNRLFVPWEAAGRGLNVTTLPQELAKEVADVFGIPTQKLTFAALERDRHRQYFRELTEAGIESKNIFKVKHGDSAFHWAIAAGHLHLAGLVGGVVEGIIAGTVADTLGVEASFQFNSKTGLGAQGENVDLLDPEHIFRFSDEERTAMLPVKLYDWEHLGSTLRLPNFPAHLMRYIEDASRGQTYVQGFSHSRFKDELEGVLKQKSGVRFSEPSRDFLSQAFREHGFLNVRRVLTLSDFMPSSDFVTVVFGITPSRWMPLVGTSFPSEGRAITEGLIVGGSQAVTHLTLEAAEVNKNA